MTAALQPPPRGELNGGVQLWLDVLVATHRTHEAKTGEEEYPQRHVLAIKAYATLGVLICRRPRALHGEH